VGLEHVTPADWTVCGQVEANTDSYPDVYGPPCEACRDANNTAKRWRRMQSLSILYNGDDAA
jgi:hypothetical protein